MQEYEIIDTKTSQVLERKQFESRSDAVFRASELSRSIESGCVRLYRIDPLIEIACEDEGSISMRSLQSVQLALFS